MSHELSLVELDAESAELLPAREALSISKVKINHVEIYALNGSVAANYDSIGSVASSSAGQLIIVGQSA